MLKGFTTDNYAPIPADSGYNRTEYSEKEGEETSRSLFRNGNTGSRPAMTSPSLPRGPALLPGGSTRRADDPSLQCLDSEILWCQQINVRMDAFGGNKKSIGQYSVSGFVAYPQKGHASL